MTTQIDAKALQALINQDAVRVVDGSWALDGTDMHALYTQGHIPGAVFFDIEAISDRATGLPHMAPSPDLFAQSVGALGISADDTVVVYDQQGLFAAARVWWTFRLMGHRDVRVLKGGLPAWRATGLAVTDTAIEPRPVTYTPSPQSGMVLDLAGMRQALAEGKIVLDARSAARFEGTAAEPRAGLRSGHMPGAVSLPFGNLIHDGALKPVGELKAILDAAGADGTRPIVTTCGSGVTAAIISLALAEVGLEAQLYDGSWSEWGQAGLDTPVAAGKS